MQHNGGLVYQVCIIQLAKCGLPEAGTYCKMYTLQNIHVTKGCTFCLAVYLIDAVFTKVYRKYSKLSCMHFVCVKQCLLMVYFINIHHTAQ